MTKPSTELLDIFFQPTSWFSGGVRGRDVFLGRDWRWDPEERSEDYLRILSMFEDKDKALYSIHKMGMIGELQGRDIGTWFTPSAVAHVIR